MLSVEVKCEERNGSGKALDFTVTIPAGLVYAGNDSLTTPGLVADTLIKVKQAQGSDGSNEAFSISLSNPVGMHQFTIVDITGGGSDSIYVAKDKSGVNGRSIQITVGGSM